MADTAPTTHEEKKKFRTYTFRGVDVDNLPNLPLEELAALFKAKLRRRLRRGLKSSHKILISKVVKAKKEAVYGEKPAVVKTHLRNTIILPEMVGGVVGVYNGIAFNAVEIKPEMVGHFLGEFSLAYKPVKHGRPGIGATHSSRFVPLK